MLTVYMIVPCLSLYLSIYLYLYLDLSRSAMQKVQKTGASARDYQRKIVISQLREVEDLMRSNGEELQ